MSTVFAPAHVSALPTQTALATPLIDNFGRQINYVRLSVTDVCNLRCVYCMPEEMRFLPKEQNLSDAEILRLLGMLALMGVEKVRITGGEPFVRPGLIALLHNIRQIPGIRRIHITTNGVLTAPLLPELQALGIAGINLSLDSLDRRRFRQITRRDAFDKVMATFHLCLEMEIPLRVNMVVMEGQNTDDILPMSRLALRHPVSVRFIEEMPFNGTSHRRQQLAWDHRRIHALLKGEYPDLRALPGQPSDTATHYTAAGFRGSLGIIAGFSRTFCGTCNRIRINSRGELQTCLYGKGEMNVRDLLRSGISDEVLAGRLRQVITRRFADGWEAQQHAGENGVSESMALIGG